MTTADEIASNIHYAVMEHVKTTLEEVLYAAYPAGDPLRPGVIKLGPLMGEPMDPEEARIVICIYENDRDEKDTFQWCDEPASDEYGGIEIGGGITWLRRFTLEGDCYFERTREDIDAARKIAGLLKAKLEDILLGMSFSGIAVDNEYVSRGPVGFGLYSTTRQSGGPPDAYQFHIKIRFEVLTTRTGVL